MSKTFKSVTLEILEDFAPVLMLFGLAGLILLGMGALVFAESLNQRDLANVCIEQGKQWIDGNCIIAP